MQVCRQAVLDARRAVAWLALQGYERIGILGTSLGSCLAMLTSAHEPRIRAQALNHVSPWFADVVWRGLSTRHVREVARRQRRRSTSCASCGGRSIRGRISIACGNTRTLLVYARYDLTFPVDLSRVLVDEFARRRLPHEVAGTAVRPLQHRHRAIQLSGRVRVDQVSKTESCNGSKAGSPLTAGGSTWSSPRPSSVQRRPRSHSGRRRRA